jgi:hypothetical protein
MAETDWVIRGDKFVIQKKAQFSMIELYRTLKAWFDLHSYNFYEKEYEDTVRGDKKSVSIKWEGQKPVDNYTKFLINLSISLKNYQIVDTKKGKTVEGDLKIKYDAAIQSDYEERWENNAFFKFTRGIFDKFISTGKRERHEKEITEDLHDIFNRTKSYLNLQKFK